MLVLQMSIRKSIRNIQYSVNDEYSINDSSSERTKHLLRSLCAAAVILWVLILG